ncbi:hypothetical protein FisN_4Lh279 [Fistulifera solaris]|uniref:Polynucleotide adenylyltransferase n=1 Tax=Fistulifera solaris TaxID=1519565 RepID=A0A1Z5KCZ8_FISSO|nr:hypothetical protein FisN_4Lh279 [Fistulifera solaris]|eukprot:GAX24190.1 hypothetical protein FisN_4Lh279 [Fistulifera solaris]
MTTYSQQQQPQQRSEEELKGFRAWLQSLSWEHLRDASSITYPRDPKTGKRHHELDLLQEMLDLQPPPPTPIHAKAIPYRPVAASYVCTDGRNQDELKFRGRFRGPSWFQWEQQQENGRNKRNGVTRYHVYQKRFVQPDGAVYTLGCTEQQRRADEELLRLCVFVEPISESTTYIQLDGKFDPRGIQKLLHIVSRGRFASILPSKTYTQSPWLEPTQRWFSLPMFLASRLELALWKSYRGNKLPQISFWPRTLTQELSAAETSMIVATVATQFLKQHLQSTREQVSTLMDSVLWKVLVDRPAILPRNGYCNPFLSDYLLDSLIRQPLVAPFDSKVLSAFRQASKNALYQEFLKATERSLMLDASTHSELNMNKAVAKKTKRRNKKKPSATASFVVPPPVATDDLSSPRSDDSHVSQHEGKDETSKAFHFASIFDFPDNGTSARDRNKNIVTALGILDSVLDSVYAQAGLEPDIETFEAGEEALLPLPVAAKGDDNAKSGEGDEPLRVNVIVDESASPPITGSVTVRPESSALSHLPANQSVESLSCSYQRFDSSGLTIGLSEKDVDEWTKQSGFVDRNESILEEFFQSQKHAATMKEQIEASSTAASLASSYNDEHLEVSFRKDFASEESQPFDETTMKEIVKETIYEDITEKVTHGNSDNDAEFFVPLQESEPLLSQHSPFERDMAETGGTDDESLSPPSTPSPRLSPILITLSDISRMQKESAETTKLEDASKICARSVSSAVVQSVSARAERTLGLPKVTSSRSIDGGRNSVFHEFEKRSLQNEIAPLSPPLWRTRQTFVNTKRARDDQDIRIKAHHRKSVDVLSTYRNAVARPLTARDDHDIEPLRTGHKSTPYKSVLPKAPARSVSYSKMNDAFRSPYSHLQIEAGWWKGKQMKKTGAQSETSLDIHDDYQSWPDLRQSLERDDGDNNTKDGSTTITSALSNKDAEDVSALRDERDAYRDMCLTLGAEVAKLKNVLAAQKSLFTPKPTPATGPFGLTSGPFDPQIVGSHVFGRMAFARSPTAMSDAGFRADYDSIASEDEAAARVAYTASVATHVDSDVSIDRTATNITRTAIAVPPLARYGAEPSYFLGMRSRLTNDMLRFLQATDMHLKKQEPIKAAAIERMTRLVNTMWPRAQVKLYGSNVTGLSLPTSDIDFVICLPAVHKKAVAVAPGVLEGRNAINESSQKLLARTLKGESWIDPRSMKLIERTVVPVIKVSTKDTKARSLQLDITFDSPGHHGIEAIQMVTQIMDELPVIRPLLLILKQFLSNRGLLTAYTGGLSAYGLFLMVARYLQEQESWGDCGSLLMGFLDFYGNNFDPRSIGISVKNRQYFSRLSAAMGAAPQSVPTNETAWRPIGPNHVPTTQFFRRYSFSDKGNIDAHRGANPSVIVQSATSIPVATNNNYFRKPLTQHNNEIDHSAMPYTLDPLLIEDPLNESNNVGRNAFRIFSVLRAFSDAHRALLASLEWDLHSNVEFQDDSEYPLLKCLLQNEDVVFNDIGR